jgi:ubiquitin-protein ligase E3 B
MFRIGYVHKMASFRVVERTREQARAFVGGFQSIVSASWLSLFSPQELQKLISGDSDDIDLSDMRRHTQYYGGFHNSHRLINWLWDVLENDFTAAERRSFLKVPTVPPSLALIVIGVDIFSL